MSNVQYDIKIEEIERIYSDLGNYYGKVAIIHGVVDSNIKFFMELENWDGYSYLEISEESYNSLRRDFSPSVKENNLYTNDELHKMFPLIDPELELRVVPRGNRESIQLFSRSPETWVHIGYMDDLEKAGK